MTAKLHVVKVSTGVNHTIVFEGTLTGGIGMKHLKL